MADMILMWSMRFAAQPVVSVDVVADGAEDLTLLTTAGVDYFNSADGQADDLLSIFAAAVETHSAGPTATASISSWRPQIAASGLIGISQQYLWTAGTTTLDPTILGWTAADTGVSATLTAPNEPWGWWRPRRPLSNPDTRDRQVVVGGVQETMTGLSRVSNFGASARKRDFAIRRFVRAYARDEFAGTSEPYSTFESAWHRSMALGYTFRIYPDETALGTSDYTTYRVRDLADPLDLDHERGIRWGVQNLQAVQV